MAKRSIMNAVHAKKADMQDRAVGGQIRAMAVAAIRGGIRSPEWRAYVMQFVEQDIPGIPVDPRQLDRLLATDGTLGDPDLDLKRAYLVAGGPCGPETRGRFGDFVDSIDRGLEPGCLLTLSPTGGTARPPKTRKRTGKKRANRK